MASESQYLTEIIESIASAYDTTGDPERKAKLMGLFKKLDVCLGKGEPIMDVIQQARTALNVIN